MTDYILGADETRWGALVGNLFVCGVLADKSWKIPGLNDSKKLAESSRLKLYSLLLEEEQAKTITIYVSQRTASQIDSMSPYPALKSAYTEVFKQVPTSTTIIVDGNMKFNDLGVDDYDITSVVKADSKYSTVMAASIIAKTLGDKHIVELHKEYPVYNWQDNKGYPNKFHLDMLQKHSYSPYHRKSYSPIKQMVKGVQK